MTRCADCLDALTPPCFAVVKIDHSREWGHEERSLSAHLYQAYVCRDCVSSYGGEHFPLLDADMMREAGLDVACTR